VINNTKPQLFISADDNTHDYALIPSNHIPLFGLKVALYGNFS